MHSFSVIVLLAGILSPSRASHFLLLAQKKVAKENEVSVQTNLSEAKVMSELKGHPGASFLRFATECPAVLTAAGRLRNSPGPIKPVRAQTVLADSPRPQLRSSATLKGPQHRQIKTDGMHSQVR